MECDISIQPPMTPTDPMALDCRKSSEIDNPQSSDSPRQECNVWSGVTPHANTLLDMPPKDNCVFKGITTSSTVPDKAIINRELSKFDSQDASHSMPIERVSPLD